MTARSDLPHIAGQSAVIGTTLEQHGEHDWDVLRSWEYGPLRPASVGERGGGTAGSAVEDRKIEAAADRRAAGFFTEWRTLLDEKARIDRRLLVLHDLAHPDVTTGRTRNGELDPILAAEVAAAGYCASCWRYESTMKEREKDPHTGHHIYRDWCRECGRFKAEHGILPPLELLRIRHGLGRRRWTQAEVDNALAAAKTTKGKSRRAS